MGVSSLKQSGGSEKAKQMGLLCPNSEPQNHQEAYFDAKAKSFIVDV